MKLLQWIFFALRELIFNSKEEYDYNSHQFNTRKFILMTVISMSLCLNMWQFYKLYSAVVHNRSYVKKVERFCQKAVEKATERCAQTDPPSVLEKSLQEERSSVGQVPTQP